MMSFVTAGTVMATSSERADQGAITTTPSLYPPPSHRCEDPARIDDICKSNPLAHFATLANGQIQISRLPIVVTTFEDGTRTLRGHLSRTNPQAHGLDGKACIAAFSGPDAYVSPRWRTNMRRGPTWDYSSVELRGVVRVFDDRSFFHELITELAELGRQTSPRPQDYGRWTMSDVPDDYIERLRPHLVAFEATVSDVRCITKFHQDFPLADALAVADHLAQSSRHNDVAVAGEIRRAREGAAG